MNPSPDISPELNERIRIKLERRALGDVLKLCKQCGIPLSRYDDEIAEVVSALYTTKAYGVILSAYHEYGKISEHTVTDLLLAMFDAGDMPSFLKQAHRFGFYHEFPEKIYAAIEWHRKRGLKDADAWEHKFAKLLAGFERHG